MVRSILQRMERSILVPLLILGAAIPFVSARTFSTGISPLNRVVEIISQMFNIPILQRPEIQVFFLRFCLFVLFLAVTHMVFTKYIKFDNKTSGVIATVFAIISAFLMPENWVTANGGVITAIFAGAIPLGLVGGAIYWCTSKEGLNKDTWTRLIAIVILLCLLAVLNVYEVALKLPILLLIPTAKLIHWRGGRR